MNKVTHYVGIDISKDTFDAYSQHSGYYKFPNTKNGFKAFVKTLDKSSCCVMEATGSYHQQLAVFLYDSQVPVAIVNPLVIKRFIQMKLRYTKTDKSDAQMIGLYAQEQEVTLWEPEPLYIDQCKMLQSAIGVYSKQSTALKNKLHSLLSRGTKTGVIVQSLKRQIKRVKLEIKLFEDEIEQLIRTHNQQLFTLITSIPGIGKKTALLLISSTNAFRTFDNYRQLSSYFGMAPTERTSGSSIRGRSSISKAGNPRMRNHLFLCSFTACEYNPQCKALYVRLVSKGKSKKLALIAVANKLLKQAFAIASTGICYDINYRSRLNPKMKILN